MREALLRELETEYDQIRAENERREQERKERIRREQPEIDRLVREREELVFGTLRGILSGKAETDNLPERMRRVSAQIRENWLRPVSRRTTSNRFTAARSAGIPGGPAKR